jgi:hypothetical protein
VYLFPIITVGISEILKWQLCNIQANMGNVSSGVNKRTFGIQYYDLGKDAVRQQMSFRGLIVFTLEVSENFHCNIAELCTRQIIPIVKEEILPFILCLKHFNTNDAERHVVFLMDAVKALRDNLGETHKIIRADLPPGKLLL